MNNHAVESICQELHEFLQHRRRFVFPFDVKTIPLNGIYILFEKGEIAHGGDRIVRIGTHTGDRQLPSRLQQHFLIENKDRSIFRKNIGRALLTRAHDNFLEQWEWDLTTRQAKAQYASVLDFAKQAIVERAVTRYIQEAFSFAVLPVDAKVDRLKLESGLISTVSWCANCGPSDGWLGLYSPKVRIRESGLWLVNELYKEPITSVAFSCLVHLPNE